MRQKGFTLIELLAVIVIIALLAVITIPKLKETITDSRKNANEISTEALVRTATNYFLEKKANKSFKSCVYDFSNNTNSCDGFEFTGDKPDSGRIQIKNDGNVAVAIQFGDYCYIKSFNQETIDIIDYNDDNCGKNASVFVNYEVPEVVTNGDGLYESELEPGRYIYRGNANDNYIKLKENGTDTLYRIISFEENGTIKVIRNDFITNPDNPSQKTIPWDKRTSESDGPRKNENNSFCNYSGEYYGCNVWGNMNNTTYNSIPLVTLYSNSFNYKYFENSLSTNLSNHSNNGSVNDESTLNKYLNGEWLTNSGLSKYIDENGVFDVGGLFYFSIYTGGDKGLVKEKEEIGVYKWNGKVGLMYITDMVETSLSSSCDSVYDNYYYNPNYWYKNEGASENTQHVANYEWPCTNNNWMFKKTNEWSLSAGSDSRHLVWYVSSTGFFSNLNGYHACDAFGTRPVFYLKSSISLRGTGTTSDPYEIVES